MVQAQPQFLTEVPRGGGDIGNKINTNTTTKSEYYLTTKGRYELQGDGLYHRVANGKVELEGLDESQVKAMVRQPKAQKQEAAAAQIDANAAIASGNPAKYIEEHQQGGV